MPSQLILRTLQSPYSDTTKGSVLTHADLDNNMIFLKGLSIQTATVVDGNLNLSLYNGDTFILPIGGSGSTSISACTLENGTNVIALGECSHAEGNNSVAGLYGYHSSNVLNGVITLDSAYGNVTTTITNFYVLGFQYILISLDLTTSQISRVVSITFNGTNTIITTTDSFTSSNAIVGASVVTNHIYPTNNQHAEGFDTFALGNSSHAEGGTGNMSIGDYSHAEGETTNSVGYASHAEGRTTISMGDYSHAEGHGTITNVDYQHASGTYNTTGNTTSLLVVGSGTDDLNRADAFRVDLLSGTSSTLATLVLPSVIGLGYANDIQAAANGIPIGGLYQSGGGIIRIRLT